MGKSIKSLKGFLHLEKMMNGIMVGELARLTNPIEREKCLKSLKISNDRIERFTKEINEIED